MANPRVFDPGSWMPRPLPELKLVVAGNRHVDVGEHDRRRLELASEPARARALIFSSERGDMRRSVERP